MKKTVLFLSLIVLSACKKEATAPEQNQESLPELTEATTQNCYRFVQQKDTIALRLTQVGDVLAGDLNFKNYEKDSSSGAVEGTISGDTLQLSYTFQSEGTTSVREMRFLKDGKSLIMGTGDMEDKAGTMVFSKPSAIKYNKSIVLTEIDCP